MRTTLRVLRQEEIVREIAVSFDVVLDSGTPSIWYSSPRFGRETLLYFNDDLLKVFDPVARVR